MANATINPDGTITGTFDSLFDLFKFYTTETFKGYAANSGHVLTVPGFVVPPVTYVKVPNNRSGDGEGFSYYPNIESAIQIRTGALANTAADRGKSDDEVRTLLTQTANDAIADNGEFDPLTPQAANLVEKYVRIYRVAVTPV